MQILLVVFTLIAVVFNVAQRVTTIKSHKCWFEFFHNQANYLRSASFKLDDSAAVCMLNVGNKNPKFRMKIIKV